ncbi:MAG: YybS family protein [Gammaproteobacteria bacterium]|nr:YybS family protein [Gammaproteobacteria bacterium]
MLALARYTLKGPYRAMAVVGLLAIVAVFIVPVMGYTPVSLILAFVTNLLAVVLVGLIILTQGSAAGVKVIAVSALALSLAAWMGLNSAEPGLSMALLQWLPVIVLAQILRSSNSLALTLLAGMLIGVLVIAFQFLFWTDLESSWVAQLAQRREGDAQIGREEAEQLVQFVRLMMLLMASSLYLMYILVIFIARWLQARLADSQGFGQEFRALALGKRPAAVAVIIVPLGLFLQQAWLISFAFIVVIAFMFQGIAIVHSRLATRKQAYGLFVLFYVLLVFTWQITGVLTAITGIVDNWMDFRKKSEDRNNVN